MIYNFDEINVYYINLESRIDRKNNIENELSKSKLLNNIKRQPAVDGKNISPYSLGDLISNQAKEDINSDTVRNYGLSLTPGGLGLLLTYIEIFSKSINDNKIVITFEDDVKILDGFDNKIKIILSELPEDFDLCYLGYCETNFEKIKYSENTSTPDGQLCCTPSLIFSPKGCAKLIEILKNVDCQIDSFLYKNFKSLKVYIANERLVSVNDLGTDIQGNLNMKKDYKKPFENLEIHMLTCNKDLYLTFNCLKSLAKFDEFKNLDLFIHDDGSISNIDILKTLPFKINFIERKIADENIEIFVKQHDFCKNYRLNNNDINLYHKIKLFDFFYFSKTKKILALDSDLLFIRSPIDIIKNITKNTPFFFPDFQNAYSFKSNINVLNLVNTGVFYIPSSEYYDINSIENALSDLIKDNKNSYPNWIEQSAFAHMFYNKNFESLATNKYRIPYLQNLNINEVECLHFVSYPPVRENYEDYLKLIGIKDIDLFFQKNYLIEFENKKIPLGLSIERSNNLYVFKYTWDLNIAGQNALDHIFRITYEGFEKEFKFESQKSGSFVINTNFKKIKIDHTYDWYGSKKWVELEEIEK
jgi:GR25 family glycosyltransferase involved in LPS biosynthesis